MGLLPEIFDVCIPLPGGGHADGRSPGFVPGRRSTADDGTPARNPVATEHLLETARVAKIYDGEAQRYAAQPVNPIFESLYQQFLKLLPAGGKILDAGCGAGRDSRAFADRGYTVEAFDASPGMAEVASERLGKPVRTLRFQDLDYVAEFNGIWASASLLHVPRHEWNAVFDRIRRALKPGGACYLSVKEGAGDRQVGNLPFTDFTVDSLRTFLQGHAGFDIVRVWTTQGVKDDGRPVTWVNALIRKHDRAD